MRILQLRGSVAVLVLAMACAPGDRPEVDDVFGVPVYGVDDNDNYITQLAGENEVPARDTRARGVATFKLSDDGESMSYRLIASNIENVIAAHIHAAPAGTNGGVVQFLYGSVPAGGGRTDGVLAEGTFTSASFIGSLAGQPMSALVELFRTGGAYVNVHTDDGVPPTNEGAGDFPGGEIRGQVR